MSARVRASCGDVEARRGACAIRSAANRGTTTPATSAARQKARDGGNWVHRLLSKFGRVITVCIISDRFRRSPVTSPETEANQGRCHRQTGASLECVAEPPGQKGVVPLFLQWRSRKRGTTPFATVVSGSLFSAVGARARCRREAQTR